ncbi:MAG: dihydrofolate reductase family protein [Bacteroidia bacterium]
MRKIKLYIAMSLNGQIAQKDGSVQWLEDIPNPEQSDYGYFAFYDSIGTTIQGNSTYQQILGWDIDFPYADKENYVLTSNADAVDTEYVRFVRSDHSNFIKNLKETEGDDIWLIGGGGANTSLLNAGLIDEIHIHVMPIILSDGIALFSAFPKETSLQLIDSKSYPSGVVEMRYVTTSGR